MVFNHDQPFQGSMIDAEGQPQDPYAPISHYSDDLRLSPDEIGDDSDHVARQEHSAVVDDRLAEQQAWLDTKVDESGDGVRTFGVPEVDDDVFDREDRNPMTSGRLTTRLANMSREETDEFRAQQR